MEGAHGTLMCRGTPVEKHWPMVFENINPALVLGVLIENLKYS